MAPASRTAAFALAALTVHYAVLSIVLHISRTAPIPPGQARYKASSAVLLSEMLKILLCTVAVFWTRDLSPAILHIKRERHTRAGQEELYQEVGPAWLGKGSGSEQDSPSMEENEDVFAEEVSLTIPASPSRRSFDALSISSPHRRASSLRVNVTAAQAPPAAPEFPVLALIPATPLIPASPLRTPDAKGLFPTRVPFDRSIFTGHMALLDIFDPDSWSAMQEAVFSPDAWKLAVLAALFVFQANAQYVASGNLSVPIFQLAYQLKIPATALCSVVLLKRSLTAQQCLSLFLLTAGVAIVQIQSTSTPSDSPSSHTLPSANQTLGLLAVITACLSSGFASTYFERVLKTPPPPPAALAPPTFSSSRGSALAPPPPSVWIRNIQLSVFGVLFVLPLVCYETVVTRTTKERVVVLGEDEGGMWDALLVGFDTTAWVVVLLQATGGLLGALVVSTSDNLAKCFSTSLSILLSFIASVVLFDFQITLAFVIGASVVLFATWRWSRSSPARKPSIYQFKGAKSSPALI